MSSRHRRRRPGEMVMVVGGRGGGLKMIRGVGLGYIGWDRGGNVGLSGS